MKHALSGYAASASGGILLALIKAYQLALSPWLGGRCRHVPSCSVYSAEAIRRFGPLRGTWLALKRLVRCHPWGTAGYDPVPAAPSWSAAPRERTALAGKETLR
jgi:hypothetical protein